MTCPKYSTAPLRKLQIFRLALKLYSSGLFNTAASRSRYSSMLLPTTIMSSRTWFMALSQMVGAEATSYGKRWYWYKPWVVLMVREGLDCYKIACVGTQLHGVSFKGTWRKYFWYTPSLITDTAGPVSSSIITSRPSRWIFREMGFLFLLSETWERSPYSPSLSSKSTSSMTFTLVSVTCWRVGFFQNARWVCPIMPQW